MTEQRSWREGRPPLVFTSRRYTGLAAVLGVALFIVNFLPGTFLTALGGGTPWAALVGGITTPFFLTTSALRTRSIFAVSVTYVVFATMAIPFLVFGPPQPYKPLMAILSTLPFEGVLWALGLRPLSLYVGISLYTVASTAVYVGAFYFLGLPGLERLLSAVYVFAAVFLLLALLSTWIAINVNRRV